MDQLKNKLVEEYCQWKTIFWVCFALNVLAYIGYVVHLTYAVDDYGLIFEKANHIGHGRWFADFIYNTLLQNSFLPSLAPIVAMVGYIITGIGLCKLWKTSKNTSLLITTLYSLHPYLLDAYTFRLSTILFSVVYLMTVGALGLVFRGRKGFAAAVALFYLTLSSYQVALGFAVVVIMVQVLLETLRERFSAESLQGAFKKLVGYALMLILSVVVYMVITKLLFLVLDVQVNARFERGFITDMGLLKVKAGFVLTVLFTRLMPVKEFILPFLGKLVLFLITLGAVFTMMIQPAKISRRLLAVVWLMLIPLGAICFTLPLESFSLPWRTCMGLVVFAVGMLAVTQESTRSWIRCAGLVCGSFLIVYFIFNNNTIIYKHYLSNQKDFVTGTRIISKIQSLPEYSPDMQLAVVGRMPKQEFSIDDKSLPEVLIGYVKHCSTQRYSITRSAFTADWSKSAFLTEYLNLELSECDEEGLQKARTVAMGKKPWPDPSSVFIHDGVVVLVLSQPDEGD